MLDVTGVVSSDQSVLVLGDPHDYLIVDLGWQASLDIHERLKQELLLDELVLLALVLLLYELYLLQSEEALACLEVDLGAQGQHHVVEGAHTLAALLHV